MNEFDKTQILGQSPVEVPNTEARIIGLNGSDADREIRLSGLGIELVYAADRDRWIESGPGQAAEVRFFRQAGAWGIAALAPNRPIHVNRNPVTVSFLQSGDRIQIGRSRFRFELNSPEQVDARSAEAGAANRAEMAPHSRGVPDSPAGGESKRPRVLLLAALLLLAIVALIVGLALS